MFAISYRNPDASLRDVALDDYLLHGPHTAIDVIGDITGAPQVNIAGLCLGGTLTTMLLAHLAHEQEDRVRSATLLNTLIDFSEPGMLGSFTDARSVRRLARKMAETGVLEGRDMALTFDLLRANDLIWSYVSSSWLMGEQPPAFDILAWNADATRMPAAMHAFYLRHCYGENELARGEMELAGTPLHLDEITAEIYLLAAEEDHIVPWTSAYKATQLFDGAGPLRAELLGPRRRDRQPAEPEGPPLDQRRHAAPTRRRGCAAADRARRLVVARLGRLDRRARRRAPRAASAWAATPIRRSPTRPAPMCTSRERELDGAGPLS